MLQQLVAKEARQKEFDDIEVGTGSTGDEVHPVFIMFASVTSIDARKLRNFFIMFSGVFCELLGSLLIVIFGKFSSHEMIEPTQFEMTDITPQTAIESTSNGVRTPLHKDKPLALADDNRSDLNSLMMFLESSIKHGKLTNLSYRNLTSYGKTLGYELKQKDVKFIRDRLCQKGLAEYNKKKELVII